MTHLFVLVIVPAARVNSPLSVPVVYPHTSVIQNFLLFIFFFIVPQRFSSSLGNWDVCKTNNTSHANLQTRTWSLFLDVSFSPSVVALTLSLSLAPFSLPNISLSPVSRMSGTPTVQVCVSALSGRDDVKLNTSGV